MVTQPETSNFPPGVYEYETIDPVQGGPGGVANLPLLQLASRTKYLLDQVNALLLLVAAKAPNDSPALTGSPSAPTPLVEVGGTQLVTAAWTNRRVVGAISITIPGNYALTLAQANYATLVIEGALTADATLVFPAAQGAWRVLNLTTGGFKLHCRSPDPAQNNVPIQPGRTKTVWTDGAGFFDAHDDLDSAVLSGTPTCSTPLQSDNSARIINSAWARTYIAAALAADADAITAERAARIAGDAATLASALAGFGNDIRNPGYQDLPSGVTLRFGIDVTTGSGQLCPALFTRPFPTQALSIVVCEEAAGGWGTTPPQPTIFGTANLDVNGFLVSACRITAGGPVYQSGLGYSYLAIGH